MALTAPLYMRILGDSWGQLGAPVRALHATSSILRARGRLRIEHGHYAARFVARILRLPPPAAAAETRLTVTAHGDGEQWQRTFDGRCLDTRQYASGRCELAERFGVLEFRFRLDVSDGRLVYVQREAAFLFGPARLRIPAAWAPRVEAREDPAGPTCVNVEVHVSLPAVGPLIAYDGLIDVEDAGA
jgi:hypothetical protein